MTLSGVTTRYQPISLLSNKNKIFEKIIHVKPSAFLSANNVLYEKQFGFLNQYSTNHALIEITKKIKVVILENLLVEYF